MQHVVVQLQADGGGVDLRRRGCTFLLKLLQRSQRGGVLIALQLGAFLIGGVGIAFVLAAAPFDVADRELGRAQSGVGGGKPRQRVRIVHLQQQLARMDLVADIDVDIRTWPATCAWASKSSTGSTLPLVEEVLTRSR